MIDLEALAWPLKESSPPGSDYRRDSAEVERRIYPFILGHIWVLMVDSSSLKSIS